MQDRLTLEAPDEDDLRPVLAAVRSPMDYHVVVNNPDLLEAVEKLLKTWCIQIEKVMFLSLHVG